MALAEQSVSTLPGVKIAFANGALGSTTPSLDGVCALVGTGTTVSDTFVLGTPYLITSKAGLEALGIGAAVDDVNATIYKAVSDFYKEAPDGTKLWIIAAAEDTSMAAMLDKDNSIGRTVITKANGAINILFLAKAENSTSDAVSGIDSEVYLGITAAQALAEWATNTLYAPLFVILPGNYYYDTPADLQNLAERSDNRVMVFIGDTLANSTTASVGLIAGRYAAIPVQRSAARVKDGAIASDYMFIGYAAAELGNPSLLHDAGFVTARTFVGKAGYFFSDDRLATDPTDDYALVPRRRVVDKAYRIAYKTLIEELGDEIPVTSDGTIPPSIVKTIQNNVEQAIENSMTAEGNLGVDPTDTTDTGVECYIDHNQNVVSTSRLSVKLRVKPYGYAKYIDVDLGFKTV